MKETSKYIDEIDDILSKEISALKQIRKYVDVELDHSIEAITGCRGKVILMGIGKSGHIASKISATFSSLGTPAFFLHPAEALHGDLGAIEKEDVVIVISHSGETIEIVKCLEYFIEIGCMIIGIVGNKNSTIAEKCKHVICVPVSEEACNLNLAPTSSAMVTLAIGDILAIITSKLKGFTIYDFANRHPNGELLKVAKRRLLTDHMNDSGNKKQL